MEDVAEIKVIVKPGRRIAGAKASGQPDSKERERREVAAFWANKNGSPYEISENPKSASIFRAPSQEVKKEDSQSNVTTVEDLSNQAAVETPTAYNEPKAKSAGVPWSGHVSQQGIQGGPGRYKRKG